MRKSLYLASAILLPALAWAGPIGPGQIVTTVKAGTGISVSTTAPFAYVITATGGGGGSGTSSLALSSGSATNSVVVSSPTSQIVVDSNTFVLSLQGTTTAFLRLNGSSVTLQGIISADTLGALRTSSATATYLQQSSATATYLQLSSATATYLPISSATLTYLLNSSATLTYLTTANAATIYLTQSSGSATYLQLSSATVTYLQISSATSTYLQLSSATLTYLNKNNAIALTSFSASNPILYNNATGAFSASPISLSTGILTPSVMGSSLSITASSGLYVTYGVAVGSVTASSITIAGQLTAGTYQGGALSACGDATHALSWSGGTFGCQNVTGSGSSGASTLAVTTGTSSGFATVASSPTSVVLFNNGTFSASLQGSATAFISLLPSSVTLQGNTFNGASQLVQTNSSTQLPAISGVLLTNLTGGNIVSGIPSSVLPSSVSYITSTQTISGQRLFSSPQASTFTYQVNVGSITGAGLGTCGSTSQAESYTSSNTFACTTITAAGIGALTGNQTITLSGDSSGSGATAITVTANSLQANITTFSSSMTVTNILGSSVTYGMVAGSVTAKDLSASQFVTTDANKKLTSTLSGATLTSLVGANIASIIPSSVLPSSVAYITSTQTFSGQNTWNSPLASSFTYQVNVGSVTGGGLSTCGDSTHGLGYNASNQFTCQSITGSGGSGSGFSMVITTGGPNSYIGPPISSFSTTTTLLFDSNTVLGSFVASNTFFYQINPASVTLQGQSVLKPSSLSATQPILYNSATGAFSATLVSASTGFMGTLQAAQEPAHTGDVTNSAGSLAMTAAALQPNITTLSASSITLTNQLLVKSTVTILTNSASLYDLFIASNPAGTVGTTTHLSISTNGAITANGPGGITEAFGVNAATITGAGLSSCGSSSQAEGYTSTGTFACTTITAAGIGALTGNQTITLSGDSTGSGATAITVSNSASQPNITTFGSSITIMGVQGSSVAYGAFMGSATIVSTGTLPAIKITANGIYGTSAGSSGGLFMDCTGGGQASGFCSQIYSNAGAQTALDSLLFLDAANTAWNEPALYIKDASTSAQSTIRIDSGWPTWTFVDTSQVTPSGKFQTSDHLGVFRLAEVRNSGDSAFDSAIIVSSASSNNDVAIGQGYNSATNAQLQIISSVGNNYGLTVATSTNGPYELLVSTLGGIITYSSMTVYSSTGLAVTYAIAAGSITASSATIAGQFTAGTYQGGALATCGDSSHALSWASGSFGCQSVTGSAGSPGGTPGNVQINQNGSFVGAGGFNIFTSSVVVSTPGGVNITYGLNAGTATFYTTSSTSNAMVVMSTNNLTVFQVSNASITAGDFMFTISSVPGGSTGSNLLTTDTSGNTIQYGSETINTGTMAEIVPGTFYTVTKSSTDTNLTTVVNILPPAGTNQTLTLPANFWTTGRTIYAVLMGTMDVIATPNLTISINSGSTVLASSTAVSMVQISTGVWTATIMMTCYSTGASGVIRTMGNVYIPITRATVNNYALRDQANTIDTTATQTFSFNITWSVANPANSFTLTNGFFEVMN